MDPTAGMDISGGDKATNNIKTIFTYYTIHANEMNILEINILIFNFGVFYMFRTRGFIFRETDEYAVTVWLLYMHRYKQSSR